MCLSPIRIKNLNRGLAHVGLNFLKDCTCEYIEVPCGHCDECLAMKQEYLVQRARLVSSDHDMYMATLTYQKKYLPICKINGFAHSFADIRDVQLLFKRLRDNDVFQGRQWKYICCSEYGGTGHRPHFHIIFFVKRSAVQQKIFNDNLKLYVMMQRGFEKHLMRNVLYYWSVNVGTRKHPVYDGLCRYVRRGNSCTYDLHYVDPSTSDNGSSDVSFYVTKYVLKFDKWFDRKQQALKLNCEPEYYKFVMGLVKPRVLVSKNFGNDAVYRPLLDKGISFAIDTGSPYPFFIVPETGRTSPLSSYLRKAFLTVDEAVSIFRNSHPAGTVDNIIYSTDIASLSLNDYDRKLNSYAKRKTVLLQRNTDEFFNDDDFDYGNRKDIQVYGTSP